MPTKQAISMDKALLDIFGTAIVNNGGVRAIWREAPPDLPTFICSNDYLGQPGLSPRQEQKLTEALGTDPVKVFDGSRNITQAALMWGKGCLGANEKLHDLCTNETKTVKEWSAIGQRLLLYTWDGNRVTTDWAGPVYLKGEAKLFKVTLEDGRSFTATSEHLVFDHEQWIGVDELTDKSAVLTVAPGRFGRLPREVKVKSIKPSGSGDYYDLTVRKTACYFDSQGILHHNSGKDLVCTYVISWLSCVLLCMENALEYFGFPAGEALDIMNVACSADQANKVFFTKLKQRISRPWFQKFGPKIADGLIEFPDRTQPIPGRPGEYTPLLRLFSGHSKTASQEGKNLIAWVMDEAAAFQDASENSNAEGVHKMLVSSARSRFANRFFGLIISYPRYEGDFMIRTVEMARTSPEMVWDIAATWEVHPTRKREDFDEDYRIDPEDAACKYECIPPPATAGFFREWRRIDESVDWRMPSLIAADTSITTRDIDVTDPVTYEVQVVSKEFVALSIGDWLPPTSVSYYLHGDPGLDDASFAVCLSHPYGAELMPAPLQPNIPTQPLRYGEVPPGHTVRSGELVRLNEPEPVLKSDVLTVYDSEGNKLELGKVVVDAILVWKPGHGQPVDMVNVKDVIIQLCKHYPIKNVTFDSWNSASLIQEIMQATHVPCDDMSFSRPQQASMYRNFRTLCYNGMVRIANGENTQEAVRQLKKIRMINGGISPGDDEKSKDVADAVVASCFLSSQPGAIRKRRKFSHL